MTVSFVKVMNNSLVVVVVVNGVVVAVAAAVGLVLVNVLFANAVIAITNVDS